MSAPRDPLSRFVDGPVGDALNALRAALDPVQAGLIAAHVTVCREDELGDLPALGAEALAHPRHARAPANTDRLPSLPPLPALTLTRMCWIRQTAGQAWETVARFSFGPGPR